MNKTLSTHSAPPRANTQTPHRIYVCSACNPPNYRTCARAL
jgi:hypothetical protein